VEVTIKGNIFILGAEKELYWKELNTLVISDLHLGKTQHFTENGIPLPKMANTNNYWRLDALLKKYKPSEVIFLGDLFHSVYNEECERFKDYILNYENIKWTLVLGNHDILSDEYYESTIMEVVESYTENGIYLTHEPEDLIDHYNICGHIHPAIRLSGKARQSLRLPCFYFGNERGIMPAFGEFTGTYTVKPKRGDQVFVIADKEVIKV